HARVPRQCSRRRARTCLGRTADDAGKARRAHPWRRKAHAGACMKPARFDYIRTGTLAEAHAALAEDGDDAHIIAGGQSLVPMLSMRMARTAGLVDIMPLSELANVEVKGNAIRVGAGVRQATLLAWPELAERQPLLAAAPPCGGPRAPRRAGRCFS